MSEYPSPAHSLLVSRTNAGPISREWTGNGDDREDHHGLIDLNEVPCYLALYWKRSGRTLHVGSYKLNLRRLVKAGLTRQEGKSARLRFVRDENAIVSIQAKGDAPKLEIGTAIFG